MGKILITRDDKPYTGIREINGKLRVKSRGTTVDKFFNGNPNAEQVKNVTQGKIYNVVRVEGMGDVESVTIIDDSGEEQDLADFFFEEVN